MNCIEINQYINEIVDDDLTRDQQVSVQEHLSYCKDCQLRIKQEYKLRKALTAIPVMGPSEGFFDEVMDNAVNSKIQRNNHQNKNSQSNNGLNSNSRINNRQINNKLLFGLPMSIAAGFALWFLVGVMFDEQAGTLSNEIAGVKISLHEVRTVNLLFESVDALADVQLSLLLPSGIELVDFPGQQEVVWHTNLNQGKNILTLKLIGKNSGAGELVATLAHASKHKTLKVKMTVEDSDQSLIYRLQNQLS